MAEKEFITANLGDARLKKRLIAITKAFAGNPNAQITQATYRFFDNQKVTFDNIILPHINSTKERLKDYREENVVLVVQDTSTADYSAHPSTKNIGPIENDYNKGLMLHPSIAFTTGGVPLGLINLKIWIREAIRISKDSKKKQIEKKESYKWIESYLATCELQKEMEDIHFINVCDREGDIYDLFVEALDNKPDLLVRAALDRCVEHHQSHLWSFMNNQDIRGNLVINVPRKKDKPARKANLSIRYNCVTIKPPKNRPKKKGLKPLNLWVVYAKEESHPNQ